jgi:hypothetical protein
MVIRFEKRERKGILPLFDRLSQQRPLWPPRRLTDREVEHRRRMLMHLRACSARTAQKPAASGQRLAASQ